MLRVGHRGGWAPNLFAEFIYGAQHFVLFADLLVVFQDLVDSLPADAKGFLQSFEGSAFNPSLVELFSVLATHLRLHG